MRTWPDRLKERGRSLPSTNAPYLSFRRGLSLVTGEVKTQKYAVGVVEWSKFVAGVEEFASMV